MIVDPNTFGNMPKYKNGQNYDGSMADIDRKNGQNYDGSMADIDR